MSPANDRPRIGLTTYGRDERNRFTLYAEYVDGVRRAGGLALLLPPGEDDVSGWLDLLDGVVLSGGGDVAPELYAGAAHPAVGRVDAERDRTELAVTREVLERGLPTFCICRGLQVLNVALGGTLIEHLPDYEGDEGVRSAASPVVHRGADESQVLHPVRLDEGSLVARVSGTSVVTPVSWHHQAIGRLGRGLAVTGRAADGVIEAVELAAHPWLLAVQWHPELSAASDPDQQRLFDGLVAEARRFRDARRKPSCA